MTFEAALEFIGAIIYPVRAESEYQTDALERAARAQCEYLEQLGEGVTSLARSNDGVSVSASRSENPFGLCREARAILKNAGLLRSGLPAARPF